jgi:hypothetical protein
VNVVKFLKVSCDEALGRVYLPKNRLRPSPAQVRLGPETGGIPLIAPKRSIGSEGIDPDANYPTND